MEEEKKGEKGKFHKTANIPQNAKAQRRFRGL